MEEAKAADRSTPQTSTAETPVHPKEDFGGDLKHNVSDRRAGRRGLMLRKRLALKIDPELTSETSQSKASESREGQTTSSGETSADADNKTLPDDEATPWWMLEYQCPPPGHLGAHDVSVAAKEEGKQDESGFAGQKLLFPAFDEQQREGTESGNQERLPFGRQSSRVPVLPSNPDPQIESIRDLKQRRPQCDSPASVGTRLPANQASPNQKRKIMHLHEGDPSMLSSMVVAKEPKRFHEPSNELPSQQQFLGAVTPSNLVRPLNKIDIRSQETASAKAEPAETSTSGSHASKSA